MPAAEFAIALLLCLLACALLSGRAWLHRRRLARVPIRIHVAGTRGKSATVRLLASGFRAGGYRVVAKVTGTRPVIILPDGTEHPIRRWGPAAIREQQALLAIAHRHKADVVVAEAMAIQPEYLWALEHFYIRATDLVITNVRPDHQEQLGPSPEAMADAITHCVPSRGRVFLAAEAAAPVLVETAAARQNEVRVVGAPEPDPEDVNTQLALAVCHSYGIAADAAAEAMRHVAPDVGTFHLTILNTDHGPLPFANAFACNDTVSLEQLWRRYQTAEVPAAFLLNPRSDRPIRTREFLKLLASIAPEAILFIASRNAALRRHAVAEGFALERVHLIPPRQTVRRLGKLASSLPRGTVLWGVGNYRGTGAELSALMRERRT